MQAHPARVGLSQMKHKGQAVPLSMFLQGRAAQHVQNWGPSLDLPPGAYGGRTGTPCPDSSQARLPSARPREVSSLLLEEAGILSREGYHTEEHR